MDNTRDHALTRLSYRWGDVLPRPRTEVDLPHGYTLSRANAMAVYAARHCPWIHGMDLAEASAHGWSAIIEHLYTTSRPPEPIDLIRLAGRAMADQHDAHQRSHGITRKNNSRSSTRFLAYWNPGAPADHAEAVTDRLAFWQIWSQLTPTDQQTLRALADHRTKDEAAQSLGITRDWFYLRLSRARTRFLALWHDGEKPSTMWITDRSDTTNRTLAKTLAEHRRNTRKRQGRHTPTPPHKRPGRDIGITNTELAALHTQGTTITELANRYGMHWNSIRDRIRKAQPPTTTPEQ